MDIQSMLRVNHAGEWGAVYIYKGQSLVFPHDKDIAHMKEQEEEHLKAFTKQIIKHETRSSWLQPLWAVGGFALGFGTALMGRKMAHTCTVAVEEVIEEHYQEQLNELHEESSEVKDLIAKCLAEEIEHKNIAAEATQDSPYPITSKIIKGITKTAIAVAKRI